MNRKSRPFRPRDLAKQVRQANVKAAEDESRDTYSDYRPKRHVVQHPEVLCPIPTQNIHIHLARGCQIVKLQSICFRTLSFRKRAIALQTQKTGVIFKYVF